ncbi:hypothetical protein BGW80DRAFT_1459146 [Lactifluus volemus]|nr:hypothetical protein BGW80DRAFT_1459146 [Lactifluus volemus]
MSWFSRTYEYDMETTVGPPPIASDQQFSFLETDGHGFALAGKFVVFITEANSRPVAARVTPSSKDMQKLAGYSWLPAILIIYEATCIKILGIIAHPDGLIQTELLIPALGLDCDWRDLRQRDSITCFIKTLRNPLDALGDYYNDLKHSLPTIF